MRFSVSFLAIAMSSLFGQQLPPRNEAANWLNQGVDAYRHGQFEQAADDFEKAADLDPTNPNAHFYVGLACVMLYVPGSDFPDNIMYFERAKTSLKRAIELIPNYPPAIASLAKLIFQQAQGTRDPDDKLRQLDEARDWYRKSAAFDSLNREVWYSLGTVSWMKCHLALTAARSQLGMKPGDPGPLPDPAVRRKLITTCGPLIEDSVTNLEKALGLDRRYDQAMETMHELLRDRADLRDSPAEYLQDIAEAGQWEQRATETRRTRPPVPPRVQRN
jgi:tetratricopeptide (TPR) repeat protein